MTTLAYKLHKLFNEQSRFYYPFAHREKEIPLNGIYVIFEKGEKFSDFDRIVRVGSHRGENQLYSRINQHFIRENKNRSIFRKNIGRCFLNKDNSHYLHLWEIDITSRIKKEKYLKLLDLNFEKQMERRISEYIQNNFSFCVFPVDDIVERLFWESKIVSTLAKSDEITPSKNWLGNYSPKEKIKSSGLWQVNEINKDVLTEYEFNNLIQMFL